MRRGCLRRFRWELRIFAILALFLKNNHVIAYPSIIHTSIACDKTDFLLTIKFNDTFTGSIYTEQGDPNCVYINGMELRQREYEAKIPLKGCQTKENNEGNLENEIVVQNGDTFDPRKDKRYLLTCIPAPNGGPIFRDSQVTLSFGGITIDSQTSTLEPLEASPELDYKVIVRDGTDINSPILTRSLSVGDNVSYTVELGDGVKGRIGHCWAKDDAGSELQLSGKDGCSLQKESQVWGNFEEMQNSRGGITLLNRIRAWAFPTSNEVNIFCNLHICAHCVQSTCGKRGRRQNWQQDPFEVPIDTSDIVKPIPVHASFRLKRGAKESETMPLSMAPSEQGSPIIYTQSSTMNHTKQHNYRISNILFIVVTILMKLIIQ